MKARFILFRRGGVFYCEETSTRKQASLHTRHRSETIALLSARNESCQQFGLNLANGTRLSHRQRPGVVATHLAARH
jgi:hypothetical protein